MLNLEFDGKGTAENGSFQVFSSISIGKHATHASFCDKGGKGAWNLSQKGGRDDKKGMGKVADSTGLLSLLPVQSDGAAVALTVFLQ